MIISICFWRVDHYSKHFHFICGDDINIHHHPIAPRFPDLSSSKLFTALPDTVQKICVSFRRSDSSGFPPPIDIRRTMSGRWQETSRGPHRNRVAARGTSLNLKKRFCFACGRRRRLKTKFSGDGGMGLRCVKCKSANAECPRRGMFLHSSRPPSGGIPVRRKLASLVSGTTDDAELQLVSTSKWSSRNS